MFLSLLQPNLEEVDVSLPTSASLAVSPHYPSLSVTLSSSPSVFSVAPNTATVSTAYVPGPGHSGFGMSLDLSFSL